MAKWIENNLPEITTRCKSICNHLYLSNAKVKVQDSVQCTALLLLQHAEKFQKSKYNDQFLWDECHAGVNKACRRPVEMQPPVCKDSDIDDAPEIGTIMYEGNPADVENDLIAKIDVERAAARNPVPEKPTEYEMAVATLGQADADFYWNYRYDMETTHQRGTITRHLLSPEGQPVTIEEYRIPKTTPEKQRFYRLKRRLGLV